MELSEDEIIQKFGTFCKHSGRNTLLTYEYELTCITCGKDIIKRKQELSEIFYSLK